MGYRVPVPRMTRSESQARTREQLIATAKQLFLRDGYFVTSLDRVAEAAGYSKGAIYANFRNKTELCLAVLDDIRAERGAQIVAAVLSGGTLEERLLAFENWAEAAVGDVGWSRLELELATQLRDDPELEAAFVTRGAQIRAVMAQAMAAAAAELRVELPMDAELIATALLSLGLGLGLQRAIDHSVPVRAMTDSIRILTGMPLVSGTPDTPARPASARTSARRRSVAR